MTDLIEKFKLTPIVWVIPGVDNANSRGYVDAMDEKEGEFTRPLFGVEALSIALAAQAAEIERLTKERDEAETTRAEQWRRRRDAEGDRDTLKAALSSVRDERDALAARVAEMDGVLKLAEDKLFEINPSNYEHDDVCRLNDACVEVLLAIDAHHSTEAGEGGAS